MTPRPVVSNTSPLIALGRLGHLELLEPLFSVVLVPPAVVREIGTDLHLPAWVIERTLEQPVGSRILGASLGPGESEAISLSIELEALWVVLDNRPARRLAQALALPVIGTLGILLASKRRGYVRAVRACLDAVVDSGFRIAPDLYERVLVDAGEEP